MCFLKTSRSKEAFMAIHGYALLLAQPAFQATYYGNIDTLQKYILWLKLKRYFL